MSSKLKELEEKLDPRVKRTRNLILTSFQSLLTEKGFESVSVQDVTNKAEINRVTFYAHFSDKYELLDYTVQKAFMSEVEKRNLNMCSYSPDNLRNLILIVCEFLVTLHSGCAQPHEQFESLVEGTFKKHLFELLSRWLKESKLPTELPATVATWAIYGLATHYSHLKKRPALETFVDEAFPLVAVNLEQFA
ncbi:MAG TPA: TetR/AcrR family transcriptional regulator [Kouleothrix sp.]|jgi:AcrR family transcriptional regulator|nr:TetR/AcrR family transcriptional regulator [Kouleothrix sp.]